MWTRLGSVGSYNRVKVTLMDESIKVDINRKREASIRKWFNMWLNKNDLGISELFADDAVYTESWGPRYPGIKKIKHWFQEWNTRGTVLVWDIKCFFHSENATAVLWYFKNTMDNGEVEEFNGVTIVDWDEDNKMKELCEFGCNIRNYDPYENSLEPVFRDEDVRWF